MSTESPADDTIEGIPLVPEPTVKQLNEKQILLYAEDRRGLISWLLDEGKHPQQLAGYATETTRVTAAHIDKWARWVWNNKGFRAEFTHDDADDYLRFVGTNSEFSDYYRTAILRSLKRYHKWRVHQRTGTEWEPEYKFTDPADNSPKEYFSVEERSAIRTAAMEYGSVPHYKSLSPSERDRWKAYLAQRFQKQKREVEPDDWRRANGWKFTSLVWVSLDVGLRPAEVERCKTSWFEVDQEKPKIEIPGERGTKNTETAKIPLSEKTGNAVAQWLEEREAYPKYDDTDKTWLTREGNPYGTTALRDLLVRLCESAGIKTEGRKITWYAIRHSVGTNLTQAKSLNHAQEVLRHKRPETTMKYNHPDDDDIRDGQNQIG